MSGHNGRDELERAIEFLDASFRVFVDIERENADFRRAIKEIKNPGSYRAAKRRLSTWVAHEDESFVSGMVKLAEHLELDLAYAAQHGGELLDKLSQSEPDIIVLGDAFPDIPVEMVFSTVRSQAQRCCVVRINSWGNPDHRTGTLEGPYDEAEIERTLPTARELAMLLKEAERRHEDLEASKEFARSFRERHSSWVRSYKEIREQLNELRRRL